MNTSQPSAAGKSPLWSVASISCPPLLLAIVGFLATPQGQAFNERVFGRLYTLGALLMLGTYGILCLGLLAAGIGMAARALNRRETPSWLPKFALGINLFIPLAVLIYRSYF